MKKLKLYSKLVSLILIVTVLFTACDVPDISKFTEASAEMTRGIRQGVNETGSVLETLASSDFASNEAKISIQKSSENYSETVKPTLKALDSLDAYLEALNALALANKKSKDNATALVTSVGNLVTTVSGLQIPETAMKLGTVAVTLFNQFQTAKDFKKRVTLVELIVNGASSNAEKPCTVENATQTTQKLRDSIDRLYPQVKAERIRLEMRANISRETDIDAEIIRLKKAIEDTTNRIEQTPPPANIDTLKAQKRRDTDKLAELRGVLKNIQKVYDEKINKLNEKEREIWLKEVGTNFCGVIDILKLNMAELKNIQNGALNKLRKDVIVKNNILIKFHNEIISNDQAVQKKISLILGYKKQREALENYIRWGESADNIADLKETINATLADIKTADDTIEPSINIAFNKLTAECNQAGNCPNTEADREKRRQSATVIVLENRETDLMAENSRLIAELNRIKPLYTDVMNEMTRIKNKQKELNSLFDSSIDALDIWGQTHSNLRVAVNSKQPLTVSRLISKTKEIWEILKPEETDNK